MKSRIMYAPREWEERPWLDIANEPDTHRPIPVEVTGIQNRPDFKPGDRVRRDHGMGSHIDGEVLAYPVRVRGEWYIAAEDGCNMPCMWKCEGTTKIPRKTSVLLRVTGPEDAVDKLEAEVDRLIHNVTPWSTVPDPEGVRVERVEDPDAKAER